MRNIGVVLALVLVGCGATPEQTAALRAMAKQEITNLNAAGIDPIQLPEKQLVGLSSLCAVGTAVVTLWNPLIPSLSPGELMTCELIMKAAATAKPVE